MSRCCRKKRDQDSEICGGCHLKVKATDGVQCQGPCGRWRHFHCMDISACKLQAIRAGEIEIRCPCPNCEPGTATKWRSPCCRGLPCDEEPLNQTGEPPTDAEVASQTSAGSAYTDMQSTRLPEHPEPTQTEAQDTQSRGQKKFNYQDSRNHTAGQQASPTRGRRSVISDNTDYRNAADGAQETASEKRTSQGNRIPPTNRNSPASRNVPAGRNSSSQRQGTPENQDSQSIRKGADISSETRSTEQLQKSLTELRTGFEDLRSKQQAVELCFQSVKQMCEAVDQLADRINEVVERVQLTVEETERERDRALSRRGSTTSQGKMCYCPENPK